MLQNRADEDQVVEAVIRGISSCIHEVYGNVGYYTEITGNTIVVEIYDDVCAVIDEMTGQEALKHLQKTIKVPFGSVKMECGDLQHAKVINYIVETFESILYEAVPTFTCYICDQTLEVEYQREYKGNDVCWFCHMCLFDT